MRHHKAAAIYSEINSSVRTNFVSLKTGKQTERDCAFLCASREKSTWRWICLLSRVRDCVSIRTLYRDAISYLLLLFFGRLSLSTSAPTEFKVIDARGCDCTLVLHLAAATRREEFTVARLLGAGSKTRRAIGTVIIVRERFDTRCITRRPLYVARNNPRCVQPIPPVTTGLRRAEASTAALYIRRLRIQIVP